jgi:raffinose/stachyose/melibiose transport system substrate-binding protein
MKNHLRTLAVLALLLAVLTGCAQPTPQVVEKVVTQEVEKVVTEVVKETVIVEVAGTPQVVEKEVVKEVVVTATPEPKDVTLVVWFLSGSPEEIATAQELVDQWAASYEKANVTVDFSAFGFEDWNNAMKLALDGGTGPDLAYGSPGGPRIGTWGEAGHLLDLTDIAEERGWFDIIPDDVMWYYNPGGPGHLWCVCYDAVTVGVYYNKEIYADLGLEPPKTFEEFEGQLATIKAAGITPIAVGAQTEWTLTHIWSQLAHTNTPWEDYEAWMACKGGVVPEMVEAAEKFEEWIKAGYFNENALATAYPDGNNLFITGQSALNIGGTWNNSTFAQQPEFEVGFFAMPPMNPELPEWHMGGFTPNNGWTVPVYSEHQEEALDLLGFMIGEVSALRRWQNGDIVAYNFAEPPDPVVPLQADVYDAMQKTMTGVYEGQPAGEIGPALGENFQAMIGGQKTAQEAMEAVDEVYQAACAEKEE